MFDKVRMELKIEISFKFNNLYNTYRNHLKKIM